MGTPVKVARMEIWVRSYCSYIPNMRARGWYFFLRPVRY